PNAVVLNNVVANVATTVGPAVAGLTISAVGVATSFFLNALSFVILYFALLSMKPGELVPAEPVPRRRGQMREGLVYTLRNSTIARTILLVAVTGMLAWEFQVTLPI